MPEELLRESLRAAVADEPPLGIDLDAVAAEGKRRQRRRRAVIGAVAATLVVVAGAAAVPGLLAPRPIPPATPRIEVVEPTDWPPTGVAPLKLSEAQLTEQGERIRRRLNEAIARAVPGARNIGARNRHGDDGWVRPVPPATVDVVTHFDRTVEQHDLPVALLVWVHAPGQVKNPPEQACQQEWPIVVEHCDRYVQADGSWVVARTTSLSSGQGALDREVWHFRADGTVVQIDASFSVTTEDPAGVAAVNELDEAPVGSAELAALATDPQISLTR